MWRTPFHFKIVWRNPAPKESRMYINTLTPQAQSSIINAFQVTENSAGGLTRIISEAQRQGAGMLAQEATQLVQNAKVALQAVKAVLESPTGQVAQATGQGSNQEVRALAQELLRKLG